MSQKAFAKVEEKSDDSTVRFRTPTDQTIDVSYESLGLMTETKMHPLEDVLHQMEADEAWGLQIENKTHNCAYHLIVFLYGKGYYDDLPREERISRIKECIAEGNQKRLREIAFSGQTDRILASENGFKAYFLMASTARMFFAHPNATGGFPVEAYYRVQQSRNCYVVAACMWLTVKLQRDNPGQEQSPIDVGYVGRRHVIDTREGLERRVISDKGDNAIHLCEKIIGKLNYLQVVNCSFKYHQSQELQNLAKNNLDFYLERGLLGLVGCFQICKNFHEKSKTEHAPTTFGYWKFDGNSVDCEGEFVSIDEDGKVDEERERLKGIWAAQLERMQETTKDYRKKMNTLIELSPRPQNPNDGDVEEKNADGSGVGMAESEPQSRSLHAMVMLGIFKGKNIAGEQKSFYMLWNWWATMPLVLVSFEYLVASGCSVYFSPPKLEAEIFNETKRNDAVAADCAFPDHAENTIHRI